MTSPAAQLVASPTWGAARARRLEAVRGPAACGPAVCFGVRASPALDAAGAALVLGGSVALWTAFLAAVL